MFEKILAHLLRLYPSGFRMQYQEAALRLIRDRARDETGFFKRSRLGWDLLVDALAGLPQAYRNSYAVAECAPISRDNDGIPSFQILNTEPLRRGSLFIAGIVSLSAMAAFGFVLSEPMAYLPHPGSNGNVSPIESVLQRLNRTTNLNLKIGDLQKPPHSVSSRGSDGNANSSSTETALPSISKTEAPRSESNTPMRTPNHQLSSGKQQPKNQFEILASLLPATEIAPHGATQQGTVSAGQAFVKASSLGSPGR